jgi:cadmium resistance protein CadD (predicted permease)
MDDFIGVLSTGFAAFAATNLDDIVVLLLFFSQVNATFRHQHIIVGQYLGFTALVLASLSSFFGRRNYGDWVAKIGRNGKRKNSFLLNNSIFHNLYLSF